MFSYFRSESIFGLPARDVALGTITLLLGPNGAGKSTTLEQIRAAFSRPGPSGWAGIGKPDANWYLTDGVQTVGVENGKNIADNIHTPTIVLRAADFAAAVGVRRAALLAAGIAPGALPKEAERLRHAAAATAAKKEADSARALVLALVRTVGIPDAAPAPDAAVERLRAAMACEIATSSDRQTADAVGAIIGAAERIREKYAELDPSLGQDLLQLGELAPSESVLPARAPDLAGALDAVRRSADGAAVNRARAELLAMAAQKDAQAVEHAGLEAGAAKAVDDLIDKALGQIPVVANHVLARCAPIRLQMKDAGVQYTVNGSDARELRNASDGELTLIGVALAVGVAAEVQKPTLLLVDNLENVDRTRRTSLIRAVAAGPEQLQFVGASRSDGWAPAGTTIVKLGGAEW